MSSSAVLRPCEGYSVGMWVNWLLLIGGLVSHDCRARARRHDVLRPGARRWLAGNRARHRTVARIGEDWPARRRRSGFGLSRGVQELAEVNAYGVIASLERRRPGGLCSVRPGRTGQGRAHGEAIGTRCGFFLRLLALLAPVRR